MSKFILKDSVVRQHFNLNLFTGNVLLAFELLPNSGQNLSVNRIGQVKTTLRFRKSLPKAVTAVIYMNYQALVMIDRHRNVTVEH